MPLSRRASERLWWTRKGPKSEERWPGARECAIVGLVIGYAGTYTEYKKLRK